MYNVLGVVDAVNLVKGTRESGEVVGASGQVPWFFRDPVSSETRGSKGLCHCVYQREESARKREEQ